MIGRSNGTATQRNIFQVSGFFPMRLSVLWRHWLDRKKFVCPNGFRLDFKELETKGRNLVVLKLLIQRKSKSFGKVGTVLLKSQNVAEFQEHEFTKFYQFESVLRNCSKQNESIPPQSVFLRLSSPEPSDQEICRLPRKDTFPYYRFHFHFFLSSERFLYYYRL